MTNDGFYLTVANPNSNSARVYFWDGFGWDEFGLTISARNLIAVAMAREKFGVVAVGTFSQSKSMFGPEVLG